MTLLTERYRDKIEGVLSCYDRIVITGTLPQLCYAQGMTGYMYANRIRIFDYPRFAEPFRDQLRRNTERLAKENDINIEHVKKKKIKKEKLIQKVLEERGTAPWFGSYNFGDGIVSELSTLAQQEGTRQDLSQAQERSVPALLFLFH